MAASQQMGDWSCFLEELLYQSYGIYSDYGSQFFTNSLHMICLVLNAIGNKEELFDIKRDIWPTHPWQNKTLEPALVINEVGADE